MSQQTFLQIKEILDKSGCEYTHLTHDNVRTGSEAAAAIRGSKLEDGAKAIILKVELKNESGKSCDFVQAVIPANFKIDLKKLKLILDSRNVALASPDEVLKETGCTIGSVPPFGQLFNIKVYADESLLTREHIFFSAGTHNDSIMMKPKDYMKIAEPRIESFRKE